jgi:hypothetical protein
MIKLKPTQLSIQFSAKTLDPLKDLWLKYSFPLVIVILLVLSIWQFFIYQNNGLALAYNDARSHLDIGRRVVEGLKPGLAQLGSVWLPLPHILMVPTIWNDYFWHSGLSGAIQSMASFVVTGILIWKILERLKVGYLGRWVGVAIFATNLNILYLQSTAMTELLLLATMTGGVYQLIRYHQDDTALSLVKAAMWIMLATLIRYDGWFLCFYAALLVIIHAWRKQGYKRAEGSFFLFCTLAGFGIFLWLVWNAAIFKDPLYFAFGPYSAHAQQEQLNEAGVLITKNDIGQSLRSYWYAMIYNSNTFAVLVAAVGAAILMTDKKLKISTRLASTALIAPLFFNILALYLGHSVLFIQGINGNTWFNVRYGIMMMPSIAVFIGFLIDRVKATRWPLIGLLCMVIFFGVTSNDAVTIDDGRVGSSQKNVSEVSGWLAENAKDKEGFILISAASHDAIIFSSGLPMARYIHEGTGGYWESATTAPDRWARWVVMRTNDTNDSTFRLLNQTDWKIKYTLVDSYPFADIYQLNDEYLPSLNTTPVLGKQK